jgi:hypothetical protein
MKKKNKKLLDLVIMIFGIALFIFCIIDIVKWSISLTWNTTAATVLEVNETIETPNKGYGNYNRKLFNETYSYSIDGKKYSFQIMLPNREPIRIRYNPKNPNEITVDTKIPSLWLILGIGIGLYLTLFSIIQIVKLSSYRASPSRRTAR